jgi:adenylate cyclase
LLSLFAYQMVYGFFVQSRGMRQISDLFGYYVPPELVEKMAENPGAFTMVPVQRELTVLFADVRGFTSISESLSPHELSDLINTYLTAMSEVIREANQGTLDKYIGDAVMAFWGAPVEDPRHAQNAVHAALGMQAQARRLSQQFVKKGWPELRIGIGLNSGPMRVGDMGSKIRRAYTVMGDAVNLGARLEGLTKHYGVGILIGEETQKRLTGWACREVDRVRVKGKNRPVAIFEPLGPDAELPETLAAELAQWQQVLLAYRAQEWAGALLLLASLQAQQPLSELYALYAKRIAHFQAHPPVAHWDGATNHESK